MPDWTKIREPAVQHCPWLKLEEGASISDECNQPSEYILDAVGGPVDSKVEVCIVEYNIR